MTISEINLLLYSIVGIGIIWLIGLSSIVIRGSYAEYKHRKQKILEAKRKKL
jgi:hypothetical protein